MAENTVTLDVEKFVTAMSLSDELLADTHFDVYQMVTHHVVRSWREILSQKLDKIEADYPTDWWEAVKARWFPRWALRRWPVRMTHIELVAQALYPDIAIPDRGKMYLHKREWDAECSIPLRDQDPD